MEIKLIPRSILISVCYRPPGMRQEQANIFVDELQISISQVLAQETDGIYLLGDFNDRCTSWEGPHPNSELKENLSDMTNTFGLHQLINEATYVTSTSANILDLIFTDNPGYIIESGTLPPLGTSKHAVVYCKSTKTITQEKPYTKGVWKYEDADVNGLNTAIGDFPFEDIFSDYEDIDRITESWTHLIIEIAKEYIPYRMLKINPKDKP